MHSPSSPPLLVYFSLAIKLPIFQDIKFEFRESQTSCNHSLVLQCIFNKSHRTCKKKKSQSLLKSCVFVKEEEGGKEIMCKGNLFTEPGELQTRHRYLADHEKWEHPSPQKKKSSSLKERKEEEQGVSLHYRVKTPLFRMDSGEAHCPSSHPSDITALSRGQSSFSDY